MHTSRPLWGGLLGALGVVGCSALIGVDGYRPCGGGECRASASDGGEDVAQNATDAGDGSCGDTTGDGNNCGRCGHSCLGGACQDSACVPVKVAELDHLTMGLPTGIVADANGIYFSTSDHVYALPIAAAVTKPNELFAIPQGFITALVQSPSTLYYTSFWYQPDGGDTGDVHSLTKAGGFDQQLGLSPTRPWSLRACGMFLCWVDGVGGEPINLYECSGSGCPSGPSLINDAPLPQALNAMEWDADETKAFYADGAGIHWAKHGQGTGIVSTHGGVETLRYSAANKRIYWIEQSNAQWGIYSCDPAQCGPSLKYLVPFDKPHLWDLELDANYMYYTDRSVVSGGVYRCPLAGCGTQPEAIATLQAEPTLMAVSDAIVTWVENSAEPAKAYMMWVAKP